MATKKIMIFGFPKKKVKSDSDALHFLANYYRKVFKARRKQITMIQSKGGSIDPLTLEKYMTTKNQMIYWNKKSAIYR